MYYIVYSFLYLFSLLPLRLLYLISDFAYLIVYHIIGYRKQVVMGNLLIAFPEKTEAERLTIAKSFYKKFIDSMLESIKIMSAGDAFFAKHFVGNWQTINQYYEQGRSVQLHMGHNFNWEWANISVAQNVKYQFLGVYMPIANKVFDKLFRKLRSRNNTKLLSANNMAQDFLPYRNTLYCLGLVADQSPGRMKNAEWFNFFKRKTAFTLGPAKNAIKNNTVVVFAFIERYKRGYYEMKMEVADEQPATTDVISLTAKYVAYLEKVVRENPDMWLWSHRRWKHKWKGDE